MAKQDEPGQPARTKHGQFVKGRSGNPSGRRKDAEPKYDPDDPASATLPLTYHADGWQSPFSGIGMAATDKRLSHSFRSDIVTYRDAIDLWRGDDLAARAIETVPAECFREGYELNIADEGDYGDLKEQVETRLEELEVDTAVETLLKFERAYGGGALLLGANDGQKLSEPLDLERVTEFEWLTPLEPIEIYPFLYYDDPKESKYGLPKVYQLSAMSAGPTMGMLVPGERVLPPDASLIHESRLIVRHGVRVSKFQASTSGAGRHWGDSALTRFAGVLRDFNIAWSSAGIIVTDFAQPVFSMKALAELVSRNRQDVIAARLAAVEKSRSVARAALIDTEEKFERQSTSVAGLPDLLDRLSSRLAAAIDMPLTLLMGQSPKGLGNEGESDLTFWYDRIKSIQKRKIAPILRRIIQCAMAAEDVDEPDKWTIKFHPLRQLSDAEQATSRLTQAQADNLYVMMGAVSADDIRKSRFGGEYSFETQVDEADYEKVDMLAPPDAAALAAMGRKPPPGTPPAPGGMPPQATPGAVPPKGPPATAKPPTDAAAKPVDAKPKTDVRADFNPDQPRDERGRWGEGGSGDAGLSGPDRAERAVTGAVPNRSSATKEPSAGLKAIAARVQTQFTHLQAGRLPEEHASYFKSTPDTQNVSLAKIRNVANRPGATESAEQRMGQALLGGPKREPVVVTKNADGTYKAIDGNHTVQVAKEHGWTDIPVRVVDAPKITPPYYTTAESEHMRANAMPRLDALHASGHSPLAAAEQSKVAEDTIAKHTQGLPAALNHFTSAVGGQGVQIEGRAKDAGSALKKVADRADKALSKGQPLQYKTVADLQDLTGMRAVIPTVANGSTIAALQDKVHDVELTYGEHNIVARDNYIDRPQPGGYRAMHFIVKDSDGLQKEVQLQTRRQQNFQTWSHDVYKPVNAGQRAVLAAHSKEISDYAERVSGYLYAKDSGRDPGNAPTPPSDAVRSAFGEVRLDASVANIYVESVS